MPWLFTGTGKRAYHDYVDEATGRMLEAEPGGTYEVRATWDKLPVPPVDGFWAEAQPAAEAVAVPEKARKGKPTVAPAVE
jgi:hypothetical protein